MTVNNDETIFTERYRPKTVEDLVISEDYRKQINNWIKTEEVPNLLLISKQPGLGKTSLAHVLINELGADALFINISLNGNIDTLRTQIQGFLYQQ